MELKIITKKEDWEGCLLKLNNHPFTQSWEWGEILVAEGKALKRLGIFDGEKVLALAQVVLNKVNFFTYAFCPKGPVFSKEASYNERESMKEFLWFLKKEGVHFFRVEPSTLQSIAGHDNKKTIDVNPRATNIIDLTLGLEELQAKMHPKTRYNINLAERKNIKINFTKNWKIFWELMKGTGKRDGFRLHEKKHYEEIFKSPLVQQITAEMEGRAISTNILVGYGETLTYLFGASDYEYRKHMAPHFLQWEAIKQGKKLGYKYYDFFGIAPRIKSKDETEDHPYDPNHQYAGVTRFKLGFGGKVVELPGTYDLIISAGMYRLYEFLRKLRRSV